MKDDAARLAIEIVQMVVRTLRHRQSLTVLQDEVILRFLVQFIKTTFMISTHDDDDLELLLERTDPVAEGGVFLNCAGVCPVPAVDEDGALVGHFGELVRVNFAGINIHTMSTGATGFFSSICDVLACQSSCAVTFTMMLA